jgi:hypothetical protein
MRRATIVRPSGSPGLRRTRFGVDSVACGAALAIIEFCSLVATVLPNYTARENHGYYARNNEISQPVLNRLFQPLTRFSPSIRDKLPKPLFFATHVMSSVQRRRYHP